MGMGLSIVRTIVETLEHRRRGAFWCVLRPGVIGGEMMAPSRSRALVSRVLHLHPT